MNVLLAIVVAICLTTTTSCNQSQANDESKTVEVATEANAPEEIESLAKDLMSEAESTEVEKEGEGGIVTITEANFER